MFTHHNSNNVQANYKTTAARKPPKFCHILKDYTKSQFTQFILSLLLYGLDYDLNEAVLYSGQKLFFTMNTSHTRSNGLRIKQHNNFNKTFTGSQYIINEWISLPHDVVTSPDVLTFKSNLDKFLYNQHFSYMIV